MAHEVFISYSTKDKATGDAVCFALEAKKIRCWIAPRDILPGKGWEIAIIDALNECKVMVLIFSTHSNASAQVQREVRIGFDKGLTVIPFRIEDMLPTDMMLYYLGGVHWLDALTPEMDKHLEELAAKALANLPERDVPDRPQRAPDEEPTLFQALDTTATLMVETVPPGATVYLDKQPAGETPLNLTVDLVLEESRGVEVGVDLEGYRPQAFQVTFSRGKSVALPPLTLQPKPLPQPLPERGRDYEQELTLSAEEAEQGCTKSVTVDNREQSITIPAGVQEKDSLPFAGLGGMGKNGGPPGDLRLHLRVTRPRQPAAVPGQDVTVALTLTAQQAQEGGDHTVEVEGRRQQITLRPRISDGETEVISNLGGKGRHGGKDGNLIVTVRVLPPEPITGKDVVLPLQLTWEEAQSGCEKSVRVGGRPQFERVTIPPGRKDGGRVEIPERGEPGQHGGPSGCLILNLKITPRESAASTGSTQNTTSGSATGATSDSSFSSASGSAPKPTSTRSPATSALLEPQRQQNLISSHSVASAPPAGKRSLSQIGCGILVVAIVSFIVYCGLHPAKPVPRHPVDQPSAATAIKTPATVATKSKFNPKDGAEMVFIPAGEFLMGDDDQFDIDNPRHKVTLSGYWIYKNVVTVAQYTQFCNQSHGKHKMPPAPIFNPNWSMRDHPIVNVRWDEAKAYCAWAGVCLPSEAEWEKAARGTEGQKFPWGDTFDNTKLWCSKNAAGDAGGTTTVGRYSDSPYGLSDMAGNVSQWCEDWYDEGFWKGQLSEQTDPVNESVGDKKFRVVRGGSWGHIADGEFRASKQFVNSSGDRFVYIGFRGAAGQ